MGALWLILLGPAFHRLFVVSPLPPDTLAQGEPRAFASSTPGRMFLTPDRLILEDTLPSGTLQIRLSGLSGGMGALEDLQEARIRYATTGAVLSGGLFAVNPVRDLRVMGLKASTRTLTVWGGETRSRKTELWVNLQPGVQGPYLLPVVENPSEIEVWWRGRPLPRDAYRIEPDGSLWLEGFPDVLSGDRLLIRLPLASHQLVAGLEARMAWSQAVLMQALPTRISQAAYDTSGGIFVYVGPGLGKVQPVFLPVGEGQGDYRFDPALGGFRYVGPGAGTHRARLDAPGEETLLGVMGETNALGLEVWGASRPGGTASSGRIQVGNASFRLWGGVRDTSLHAGTFRPGPWTRWVGGALHVGGLHLEGEGDPETGEGRWDLSARSGWGWVQTSGILESTLSATADAGVAAGKGLFLVGRTTVSPLDTLVFGGIRFEGSEFRMDAGIRLQNSEPREELRLQARGGCNRLEALYVGGEPFQGTFRWCRGALRGEHRREWSLFPERYTYSTRPSVIQRHRIQFRFLTASFLWDEQNRFQTRLELAGPRGGVGWTESHGEERFRDVQAFWSSSWGAVQTSYSRTEGMLAAEIFSSSFRLRRGMWSFLGAYDRRSGTLNVEHTGGGIGYALRRGELQASVEGWYHATHQPSWYRAFPRGLELRLSLSGAFELDGGVLTLSGGLVARQDGWVAPSATFTYRGGDR